MKDLFEFTCQAAALQTPEGDDELLDIDENLLMERFMIGDNQSDNVSDSSRSGIRLREDTEDMSLDNESKKWRRLDK